MNTQRSTYAHPYLIAAVALAAFILLVLAQSGQFALARTAADYLYLWLLFLGGAALFLGVFNVLWFHVHRIRSGKAGWIDSVVLVAAMSTVLIAGLLSPDGAASPFGEWVFDSMIAPGQATLFALVAFFMAAAGYQYLRVGRQGGAWLLTGALLTLIVQMPALHSIVPEPIRGATVWLIAVPVMAAARGVLLGGAVALLVLVIVAVVRSEA